MAEQKAQGQSIYGIRLDKNVRNRFLTHDLKAEQA